VLTTNRGASKESTNKLEDDHISKSESAEVSKLKLTSEDAVIVILGPTGVGKSHFIQAVTGIASIKVGATLESGRFWIIVAFYVDATDNLLKSPISLMPTVLKSMGNLLLSSTPLALMIPIKVI
jgi:energy-coupling factor transporter ATP-binding protein EcfA2